MAIADQRESSSDGRERNDRCGLRREERGQIFFIKQLNRKGRVLPIFIFILNSFPMQ